MGTYSGNAETDKPWPNADTRHISIPTRQQVRVVAEAEMTFYHGPSSPSAYRLCHNSKNDKATLDSGLKRGMILAKSAL